MSGLSTVKMTSQQYLQMGEDPPGVRLELVNGKIVLSPSASADHSEVILALAAILRPYVKKNRLGRILADVDTVFSADTTRRPDILFVAKRREKIIAEVVLGAPDLCVEVISLSSATIDRVEKFELYRASGVKNYWIIDPQMLTAEAFVLRDEQYTLAVSGRGDDVVRFPPFGQLAIDLAEIWPGS